VKRILIAVLFALAVSPAYAQQWDQVNGSMQVKSGPTAPLVIIDQTASGQKILSLRANGTEKCCADASGNLNCAGTFTLTGQMIGTLDTDCSAPSYSGAAKLTTGFAVRTAPSAVTCVGGSLAVTTSATQHLLADTLALAWSDVSLSRGAADVLALATGDSFNLVGGGGSMRVANVIYASSTAITVTSAGTSPSITTNGSITGRVNVGTGGTATTIVLAMPTATTGWNCYSNNITAAAANRANLHMVQQSSTTTAATLQWQTVSTGAATAFVASDIVSYICFAY